MNRSCKDLNLKKNKTAQTSRAFAHLYGDLFPMFTFPSNVHLLAPMQRSSSAAHPVTLLPKAFARCNKNNTVIEDVKRS